jgi:hypothetical protein
MSADLEQREAKLTALQQERDGLLGARTKEATAEAATLFLEGARRHSQGVGGLVVGGHAAGQPLDDVLRAFLLSDPKLEAWLVEQAEQFAELTSKQRDSQLRKVNAEIEAATAELRSARKAKAIAAIEAEFAGEAA